MSICPIWTSGFPRLHSLQTPKALHLQPTLVPMKLLYFQALCIFSIRDREGSASTSLSSNRSFTTPKPEIYFWIFAISNPFLPLEQIIAWNPLLIWVVLSPSWLVELMTLQELVVRLVSLLALLSPPYPSQVQPF